MPALYLASRSPRRRLLLASLVADFEILDVDIDEIPRDKETAHEYVARLSREKALQGQCRLQTRVPVLAADTEVVLNNKILGKPETIDEAVDMLLKLSGQSHLVYSAVSLATTSVLTKVSINRVWFRQLGRLECENYCRRYSPLDKAGAYGIQERAASFLERFEGSYSAVMGLPLLESRKLLAAKNIL